VIVAQVESRAYSRVTEVLERVKVAVLNIFPEDVKEQIKLKAKRTESHYKQPIIVISSTLKHTKSCEATFDYILGTLTKQEKKKIAGTLDLRIDEQCTLYLRFDKQSAFLGKISLYDGPDPISINIHFRAYPRCEQEELTKYILERLKKMGCESD